MIPKYLSIIRAAVAPRIRPTGYKLRGRKNLLLGMTGFLALAAPIGFGLAPPSAELRSASAASRLPTAASQVGDTAATSPKFEVASIKPNKSGGKQMFFSIMNPPNDGRFYATGPTLKMLLRMAYNVQDSQILGGPSWIDHERFDIQAKADSSVNEELKKLSPDQAKLVKQRMLQNLLADRFKLTLRHETKTLPVYALVVAKRGPKLQESKDSGMAPIGGGGPGGPKGPMMRVHFGRGEQEVASRDVQMSFLAQMLSQRLGRTVLDKTGLKGRYSFTLKWSADVNHGQMIGGPGPVGGLGPGGAGAGEATGAAGSGQPMAGTPPGSPDSSGSSDSSGPSIFTAIQQQLGLRLKPAKGPVEVLVVDRVEQPSAN
jgi:uncharacterized protein (TIGR03435 family)